MHLTYKIFRSPNCPLLHRKQTFFVWQLSGDEQHHCVFPIWGPSGHDFCHRLNLHRTHSPFRRFLHPVKPAVSLLKNIGKTGKHQKGDYTIRPVNGVSGFAPIFPDTCYHLIHYWPAAADIPVASDNPAHYANAIRYDARTPLQGSLLPLTRLVWA